MTQFPAESGKTWYKEEITQPGAEPNWRENRRMQILQDNVPCHAARTTMDIFRNDNIRVINITSKRPDTKSQRAYSGLVRQPHPNLRELADDVIRKCDDFHQQCIQGYLASMIEMLRSYCRKRENILITENVWLLKIGLVALLLISYVSNEIHCNLCMHTL